MLSKISLKNENNKSSHIEEMEILRDIGDNSIIKTPSNINMVPDFLKDSEENKDSGSGKNSIKIDPFDRLQREEWEFSGGEILNESSKKLVLSENLSNFFPKQIDNINFEILEKVSKACFFQYSVEESTYTPLDSSISFSCQNLGLPRCISV